MVQRKRALITLAIFLSLLVLAAASEDRRLDAVILALNILWLLGMSVLALWRRISVAHHGHMAAYPQALRRWIFGEID